MSFTELRARIRNGTGELAELTLRPRVPTKGLLQEGLELEVFAPSAGDWRFLIDDEPLALSTEGTWRWTPGFYAGLVSAELRKGNRLVDTYHLEVSPHPRKLAFPLYQQMLHDLARIDPLLVIGTEPATERLGALGSERDPWLEFRRLRMHAPQFVVALRQMMEKPIHTVRAARRVAPIRAARRVDMQTVRSAAMTGVLGSLVSKEESHASDQEGKEPTFDLPWFEEHLDGAANRCITAMLLAVRRRAFELLRSLDQKVCREQQSETRTGLADRWPARREFLMTLSQQLRMIGRAEPFRSVTCPEITAAGLNAVSAHPVYSRAHRCGWQAIRPGLQGSDADESVWLCPTWELYERWCFGKTVDLLRRICKSKGAMWWGYISGRWKAETTTGIQVTAYYQRAFTAKQTAEFHSISRERRPDIVITAQLDDQKRFLALDSKYTQARPGVLEAMASAHIYNDSLRWHSRRPWKTLLLVPAGGGASWLEDEEFIDSEGVGVVAVSPEGGGDKLAYYLGNFLEFPGGCPPEGVDASKARR